MSDNTFITFGGVKLEKSSIASMRIQICTDPYYGSKEVIIDINNFWLRCQMLE